MPDAASTGRFVVPFGRGDVEFRLPPGLSGELVTGLQRPAYPDPAAAARAAIADPLGSPSLRALARGKRRVCIAVTDATRACPDHLLVPPMLAELHAAGVAADHITLLVAVGAHRASTAAEKRAKLGPDIVARYRVIDHDAANTDALVPVVEGPGGIPFRLNRVAVEADLLLATGIVEPHQYAGFSGGGKTVAIGCADETVIAFTHGPAVLDLPGTRLALLNGNPFQEAVRRVAAAARLAFVGNAVLDELGRVVAIAYGAPTLVHDALAEIAGSMFTVRIARQADIAVAGVGHPKDTNLYQASRAASYLQFAPVPVVRSGGVIILPAACPEGAGAGAGERRFLQAMDVADRRTEVIERARRDGIRPGEQRAYVMARVLEETTIIVAGVEDADVARAIGFVPAASIDQALALAVEIVGTPATVLVVPHALTTLPLVSEGSTTAPA